MGRRRINKWLTLKEEHQKFYPLFPWRSEAGKYLLLASSEEEVSGLEEEQNPASSKLEEWCRFHPGTGFHWSLSCHQDTENGFKLAQKYTVKKIQKCYNHNF